MTEADRGSQSKAQSGAAPKPLPESPRIRCGNCADITRGMTEEEERHYWNCCR